MLCPQDGNNNVDMSFFAPDCFHMSVKGHRAIAAGLWNNMVSTYMYIEHTLPPTVRMGGEGRGPLNFQTTSLQLSTRTKYMCVCVCVCVCVLLEYTLCMYM